MSPGDRCSNITIGPRILGDADHAFIGNPMPPPKSPGIAIPIEWPCLHPFSQEDEVGRGHMPCDFFIYQGLFDYTAWEHLKYVRLKKAPIEPDEIPLVRGKDHHGLFPKEPKEKGEAGRILQFKKPE